MASAYHLTLLVTLALSVHAVPEHGMTVDGVRLTGPYFDPRTARNVTAQAGGYAFLPCSVRQLMDKVVSWVRNRDSHILSTDRYTFIADSRFQVFHREESDSWTMQIKFVQPRDAGVYECQVSTEPKISRYVHLTVVEPQVEIGGGDRDMFVNAGSTISIKCAISRMVAPPAFVFWYQGRARLVPPAGGRRRIQRQLIGSHSLVSMLVIDRAKQADSGNYTCSPSGMHSASVRLHVLNGEHHAAMQDGVSSARPSARLAPGGLPYLSAALTLCITLKLLAQSALYGLA